jgi:hypothetical protein
MGSDAAPVVRQLGRRENVAGHRPDPSAERHQFFSRYAWFRAGKLHSAYGTGSMLLAERTLVCAIVRDLDTGELTPDQLRGILRLPADHGK